MTRLRPSRSLGWPQQARLLLIALLLLSLGAQQWAAQSHVHVAAASLQAGSAAPAGDTGEGRIPGHDCLWCQLASHSGPPAPPSAWTFIAAGTAVAVRGNAYDHVAPSTVALSWSWRSRGPPTA